jgi:hypothetical protein
MDRDERLKDWIKKLTNEQKDKIILELSNFAIESEEVSFYEMSESPYWSNTGDKLEDI